MGRPSVSGAGWTPARVLAAAEEWVWVPEDAEQLKTVEYHVIAYPEWFAHPTQVAWCRSSRTAGEVISEVEAQVRAWARNRVGWWLSDGTRPRELERQLLALGAQSGKPSTCSPST